MRRPTTFSKDTAESDESRSKLSFELFTTSDNFSTLDLTEEDGTDPLGIDGFI